MQSVIVLGAGYAGLTAAQHIARYGGKLVRVTLVDASEHFVERIRLHEFAVGGMEAGFSLPALLKDRGVTFIQGRVMAIEPQTQHVQIDTADGATSLRYDRLVYALGSRTKLDLVPGIRDHAWTLAPNSIPSLHQALQQAAKGASVVVVGGGATGIEMAAEVAERLPHLKVTLVSAEPIGPMLSPQGRAKLNRVLQRLEIRLVEKTPVQAIKARSVETATESIAADVCIWAGPMEGSPLAHEAGLSVNRQNQMLVDSTFRSIDHPMIFGAGDGVFPVETAGAPIRMACATAIPMGQYIAKSVLADLAGRTIQPFKMRYLAICISLGRTNGIVQWVHSDDSPRKAAWTGKRAMVIKRFIVAGTNYAMRHAGRSQPKTRPSAQEIAHA